MKPRDDPMDSFYGKYLFGLAVPENHPFRILKITIDWENIREELKISADSKPVEYSNNGRPSWDPLVIFKMLLLQRWHPASDDKVEERARTDVAYRYFLDLPFPAPVPDATTLSRYRTFWGDSKVKQLFKNIFQQIQNHGAARVRPGIVGDTTHQHARIQKPTARQLILNGFVKYLQAFEQLADSYPDAFEQPRIQELLNTTGKWLTGYQERYSSQELSRQERFACLVNKIQEVQEQVQDLVPEPLLPEIAASESWKQFQHWKTTLEQLLTENVTVKDGQPRQKKGDRKIISLVDPDARSGHKSKKLQFTGYKVVAGMTLDRFYTNIETIPGNENDSPQAVPIVEEAIKTSGETPEAAGFDLGFNATGNRLDLRELGVQPGIEFEQRINARNPGLFTADQFLFDSETMTVTCPAGQSTSKHSVFEKQGIFVFRFPKKCCQDCPVKTGCTTSKNGRTVRFSMHFQVLEQDREFLATEKYEELRKNRWGLEAVFGTSKKAHGLAHTPYHGLEKTSIHNRLVGIVYNLKRLTKLVINGTVEPFPTPSPSGYSV